MKLDEMAKSFPLASLSNLPKVVLIGLENVVKSSLFSSLTVSFEESSALALTAFATSTISVTWLRFYSYCGFIRRERNWPLCGRWSV